MYLNKLLYVAYLQPRCKKDLLRDYTALYYVGTGWACQAAQALTINTHCNADARQARPLSGLEDQKLKRRTPEPLRTPGQGGRKRPSKACFEGPSTDQHRFIFSLPTSQLFRAFSYSLTILYLHLSTIYTILRFKNIQFNEYVNVK